MKKILLSDLIDYAFSAWLEELPGINHNKIFSKMENGQKYRITVAISERFEDSEIIFNFEKPIKPKTHI